MSVSYVPGGAGGGGGGTLGQQTMATSSPVVLASDQSDVPVRVSSYEYPISSNNSSTAQLAAGASFTGVIETAQDQPSISILMTSDQPMTVTIKQFIDLAGTFAAPDIVMYVRASEGLARSLTINGNYIRVIAQNNGASTTTTFNLNVAFGTLSDADGTGVLPVTELPLVLIGQATQTATVNNILTPTASATGISVSGYRCAAVQVVSTGTAGTFIFEQSNDNVNWVALPVFNNALTTGAVITAAITATASAIIYSIPIRANFLRLRIATTITGGSIQAFTRVSTESWTPSISTISNGPNTIGVSGTVTVTSTRITPNAADGHSSHYHLISAASTNDTLVLTGARAIGLITATNINVAARYLKIYNKATAPTSADTPIMTILLPPGQTVVVGGTSPIRVPLGLGIRLTTGIAIADTAAVAASEHAVSIAYT
jgi:hypothetical protein